MKEVRISGFEGLYDAEEYVMDAIGEVIPSAEFVGTVVIQIYYEEDDTNWDKEAYHIGH